ncbi:MerR family transcriptional regulator [Methylobacterium frigidaeris]|uniref:MerR family transcriptional regulator n=2 Tax=Methylobacterium frigidaeris TaxID=2038277 RepID=UPI001EE1141E|nr:MerR family transcriptional regulator [Methylobacterium frigidaeris]
MNVDPLAPRYTQPDVLRITGLKPTVLQTWINRRAIELAEQNPGTGRKRLYSENDVVKLAIMRRLSDLSIDLSVSKEIAEAAAAVLVEQEGFGWDEYLFLTGHEAVRNSVIEVSARNPLQRLGGRKCDPFSEPISAAVYWRLTKSRMAEMLTGAARYSSDALRQPLSTEDRELYARHGIHAEPAVVFPIGEIVNGTLAQLEALDVARAEQDVSP